MNIDNGFPEVAEALSALVDALNRCKSVALRPGTIGRGAFFGPTGNYLEGDAAELFIKAISDWDVMDDAENGNVPRYPALLEADVELIDAVEAFNSKKLAFREAVATMGAASDKDRQRKLREALRAQSMSRAHPLQCWREVKIFRHSTIKTVGFSTSKKSFSSKTMTRLQAISELEKRGADDVIEQMGLNSYQSVRWINPVSPFIRVNISYRNDDGDLDNATFHASLPVLIEMGSWPVKLKFNQPKECPQERRGLEEGDLSIIPLPFRRDAYLALR